MPRPLIHGSRGFVPASTLVQAIADSLSDIRRDDKLTYADIGAAIGKSEDQAAKYCDGTATMDACTFLRACTFWNGRFANGPLALIGQVLAPSDALVVDSREGLIAITRFMLEFQMAMIDNTLADDELLEMRKIIEDAGQLIDGLRARLATLTKN
jgi:hypothetical protein